MSDPAGPSRQPPTPLSPDGAWWWDGVAWRPAVSADGRWRWNGAGWVPSASRRSGPSGIVIGLIAGGVVVAVLAVSVPIALVLNLGGGRHPAVGGAQANPGTATSIPCDQLEHTLVHYHAFLQILDQGVHVTVPTNVGRSPRCYYWLHMHTQEPGIIHVEAPANQTFTLGDFFDVWGAWSHTPQRLDETHVSTRTLTGDQKLAVYVDLDDGAGPKAFAGDPRGITLRNHEIITLEITPPSVTPPPSFSWPSGF